MQKDRRVEGDVIYYSCPGPGCDGVLPFWNKGVVVQCGQWNLIASGQHVPAKRTIRKRTIRTMIWTTRPGQAYNTICIITIRTLTVDHTCG
jgi:hypothetical protein